MGKQSPGIFGARFCTVCGQRQRSPNHTCHPSAVKKALRIQEWAKPPEAPKKK